jgi:hypothetical protein
MTLGRLIHSDWLRLRDTEYFADLRLPGVILQGLPCEPLVSYSSDKSQRTKAPSCHMLNLL